MDSLNADMIYEIITQSSLSCCDIKNIWSLNKTLFNRNVINLIR